MVDLNNNGIDDEVETAIAEDRRYQDRRRSDREHSDERIRARMDWIVVIAALLFASIFYGFGLYYLLTGEYPWLVEVLKKQFAAIVMPPLVIGASIVVVSILKLASGDVKIKFLTVQFEGSTAPIVMFLVVYAVIISSIHLLWI